MVQIGIAVVESRGRYLVGTRKSGQDLAGLAEFPGGKCEQHESLGDCAVRECREETGVDVIAVEMLERKCHEYDHATVDLHFWLCRPAPSDSGLLGSEVVPLHGFEWKSVDAIKELSFPEANASVVQKLIAMNESSDRAEESAD